TVHQAKGLEFPVVFLADVGRKLENDIRNPVVDSENGLLIRDVVGSGMDEIPNQILADFRKRSNSEQEAESLRLLYVALTRARDRLIISEGAMVQGWAKQIRSFIGGEIYAALINSGREQQPAESRGVQIVLMRPESLRTSHETALATASPVDGGPIA